MGRRRQLLLVVLLVRIARFDLADRKMEKMRRAHGDALAYHLVEADIALAKVRRGLPLRWWPNAVRVQGCSGDYPLGGGGGGGGDAEEARAKFVREALCIYQEACQGHGRTPKLCSLAAGAALLLNRLGEAEGLIHEALSKVCLYVCAL